MILILECSPEHMTWLHMLSGWCTHLTCSHKNKFWWWLNVQLVFGLWHVKLGDIIFIISTFETKCH